MPNPTTMLPFQPATMSTAQLAAVCYLARYSGRTHVLYAFQLRQWFTWRESNALDPLVGTSALTSSCTSGTSATTGSWTPLS